MKNLQEYNKFVQSLEKEAKGGLFFHHVNEAIVITDFEYRLLGQWHIEQGRPTLPANSSPINL